MEEKLKEVLHWLLAMPAYEFEGKPSPDPAPPNWGFFITVPDDNPALPRKYKYAWKLVNSASIHVAQHYQKGGVVIPYRPEPPPKETEWSNWTKLVNSFLTNDLAAAMNAEEYTYEDLTAYKPELQDDIRCLLFLRHKGILTAKQVKDAFKHCWDGRDALEVLINEGILAGVAGNELAEAVQKIVADNPKVLADYKKGKKQAINGLIGPLVRQFGGKADANEIRRLLQETADRS